MTQTSQQPVDTSNRYPLSETQEFWCERAAVGSFGPRFLATKGFRITGPVDVQALQGALDDVVRRHELLRTIVVHDVEPHYQQVYPPCPVPLEVRELSPNDERSRDQIAEDLLTETEAGSLDVLKLPLLRALFARFDDNDSVFTLMTHHSACDGWSLHLILRDLAACYAARLTGTEPDLPPTVQYREYTAWQREQLQGSDMDALLQYWRDNLAGGGIFAMPTDRPVPKLHSRPYSELMFTIDAEVISELGRLAKQMRCSTFMIILATFDVFAHRLTGTVDPIILSILHGRSRPEFNDSVGSFLNLLPLRTDLDSCVSFRDVVLRNRMVCLEAFSHEVPLKYIEQEVPTIGDPLAEPYNSDFTFGFFQSPFDQKVFQLSGSMVEIRKANRATPQNPGGVALSMAVRSTGELFGTFEHNLDEFDAETVANWISDYRRLVATAVSQPDLPWREL
ncbi:MAG TPA: condensation domain-containing protein [Jatrophihabitans sp.]|nr:condensation domain-containing protein [Jatrophihabitans sp.]